MENYSDDSKEKKEYEMESNLRDYDFPNDLFFAFGPRKNDHLPNKRDEKPEIPAWFVNFIRNRGNKVAFHGHQIERTG